MAKRSFNRPPSGYSQYPSVTLPERWPLVTSIQSRDVDYNKDARLINCYAEKDVQEDEYWVEKRPGYGEVFSIAVGIGRGHYNWRPNSGMVGIGGIYSVIGGNLYKNAVLHGAVSNGGSYFWEPMIEGPYLVLGNGLVAFYTNGTVLTQITDVDFPSPYCLGAAYLNGRLYVMRPDGGIQGSDLGDPSAWDPLNLIFARNNPDGGVAIAKQLSYLVAIKQWTTEFFEDVGNATGSPLAPVEGAMLNYGGVAAETVVDLDGMLIWVCEGQETGPQVGILSNLTFTIVSSPQVDRILRTVVNWGIAEPRAYPLKVGGHRFYILSVFEVLPYSLVYDIDQKLWYYWSDTESGVWPFCASTTFSNQTLLQRLDNGSQVRCEPDYVYPTDAGTPAPVDIYTANFDFGLNRSKNMNMMVFRADQVSGSTIDVRFTDDDYSSWSLSRTIDLSIKNPQSDSWGSFIRRAYNIRHNKPTRMRIKAIDIQVDIGTF